MSVNGLSTEDRARLAALAAHRPAFEAGFDFGTWRGGTADAEGVIQMPWFDFSPAARDFLRELGSGWVRPFDWPAWVATPEGQALVRDRAAIGTASVEDLERLLTSLVRGDRFHEGLLADAYERGLLLAAVRRAASLLAGG